MSSAPDTRPRTVVLLQYAGIGDLVWHIPYFERIAQDSQAGRVSIAAQPSTLTRAFVGHEPWVDQVIDHDHRPRRGEGRRGRHGGFAGMRRFAAELRAGGYDRIILFSGRSSRGLIAWLSGIPIRQGFGYRPLQRLFLNSGPYIERYQGPSLAVYPEASAFMVAHGWCQAPVVPCLRVPLEQLQSLSARLKELPRPLYAFAIGTSETHKQWGTANFAELARALMRRGCGVMLLGGPGEVELAREIRNLIPPAEQQALTTVVDAPVLGSAAALKLSDYCVGNDTGMVNVAAAVGCRSWVIIGARETLDQDPQRLTNLRAARLQDITVDQVLRHLDEAAGRAPAAKDCTADPR